jgi:hypothetical protein
MGLPRTDPELLVWLNNFHSVFGARALDLGFTPADVHSVMEDAEMFNYLAGDLVPTYKAALQARTAYKNLIKDGPLGEPGGTPPAAPTTGTVPALVAPGIVPRLRALIQRIQLAPGYTQAIGLELGIVSAGGGGASAPAGPPKPTAKAVALPNSQIQIDFVKGGFTGVLIEGRRTGDTEWAPLGVDNFSPYVDTRPPLTPGQAEVREYRLRYLDRDEPVGDFSDIISASTTP